MSTSGYRNDSKGLPTEQHVLTSESIVTLSDYQQQKLAESYQKLIHANESEQNRINQEADKIRFYNLSLREFGERAITVWSFVLRDIYGWMISFHSTETTGDRINRLFDILVQEDRMIYVGVLFVLISMFMYFFTLPEAIF